MDKIFNNIISIFNSNIKNINNIDHISNDIITLNNIYFEKLKGGCSDKLFYKIIYNNIVYIFIIFPNSFKNSDEIFINNPLKNNQFYTYISIHNIIKFNNFIPNIFYSHDNFIFMQYLGQYDLSDFLHLNNNIIIIILKYYKKLIKIIHKIQNIDNNIINKRQFDYDSLFFEMKQYFINFFNINNIHIIKELEDLCLEISKQPYSTIHRDFQSKNIMIFHNKPFIIDYGDMCQGPFIYDIISLLFSQNYILSNNQREELLIYYKDNYFSKYSKNVDNLFYLYQLTAIHRVIKSFSRHYYFYKLSEKNSNIYKKSLFILKDLFKNITFKKKFINTIKFIEILN